MIEYIKGELAELTPALAVVEAAGVGYALNISLTTYTALQGKRQVKLYVHEVLSADAVQLRPGTPVRLLHWGGAGTLQAHVRRVEPGGFTKVSALGVEEQRTRVILDFDSPRSEWAALGDAYRVELEFLLRHEDRVLQVPASSLFLDDRGKPGNYALYRVVDGRARLTPVRTGLRSATHVQVLEGLAEGDAVIVQPDERIVDGTRIEAH